jgi:hypothetical protein
MSDIIERLRAGAERVDAAMGLCPDAIEHLRNTVVAADREIKASHADADRYRDQIGRLTAALESLLKDPPATLDEPDPDWDVIKKMRAVARDALEVNR